MDVFCLVAYFISSQGYFEIRSPKNKTTNISPKQTQFCSGKQERPFSSSQKHKHCHSDFRVGETKDFKKNALRPELCLNIYYLS